MHLAAFLDFSGEPALVVGGGPVALRRTRTLLDAGMTVTVVAPELLAEFEGLEVRLCRRPFEPADLTGVRVVVAATSQPAVNDVVAQAARAAGLLVNHAGEAGLGNLRFPAVAEQGGVQVAVSTGRDLPLLARALAEQFGTQLPEAAQLDQWQQQRATALGLHPQGREAALLALRQDISAALSRGHA